MKDKITFEEFLEIENKLEIRIGQVITAERVPKSDKLLKLSVSFDIESEDTVTVVTNIGLTRAPEGLVGLTLPFVVNLAPVKMMGITSEAMIIAGTSLEGEMQLGLDYLSVGSKLL